MPMLEEYGAVLAAPAEGFVNAVFDRTE